MPSITRRDKEKAQYKLRKEQMNKDFLWTEDAVRKLVKLDKEVSKVQARLVKEVRAAYKLFSELEKSGLSFLHGFKVIGSFVFEKEILGELDCLSKLTEEEEAVQNKWVDLQFYSSKEIDAWQLVFDSEIKDFMPLSKIRMRERRSLWELGSSLLEDHEYCSYLAHFIDYNSTFSNADLLECTVNDFHPVVKVVINHNVSELSEFSKYHSSDSDLYEINLKRKMIEDRCFALNKSFDWTEENVQKIMEVNSWFWKRTEELKANMMELNAAFHLFSQTDPKFCFYTIDGQIEYHGSKPNDMATLELQNEMSKLAGFNQWNLELSESRQKIRDDIHNIEDINWNLELFCYHLSDEQCKVPFHYLMHTLFVDDDIYSLEDLVRMREEDLKACMIIEWSEV